MERYEASYRNSAEKEALEADRHETRRDLEESVKEGMITARTNFDTLEVLGFEKSVINVHSMNPRKKNLQTVYSRETDDGLEVLTWQEVDVSNSETTCLYKTSEVIKPQGWYDKFSPRAWETKNDSRVVAGALSGALGFTAAFQYAAADEMSLLALGAGTIVVFAVSTVAFIEAGFTYISTFNPLRRQEVAKGVDALLYIADALEEKEPTKFQRVMDVMNTPIGDLYKSKVRVEIDEVEAEFEEAEVANNNLGAKR